MASRKHSVVLLLFLMTLGVAFFVAASKATTTPEAPIGTATLLYSFSFMNFTWQSADDYDNWFNVLQGYKSGMLAGIKVSPIDHSIYVSVPRWKPNVPATLSKLVQGDTENGEYLLDPFPSWEMNTEGDPEALQSVLGFEIDAYNRLWILDQGKVNGQPAIPNSIKLLIYNLNDTSLIQNYTFSEELASLNNSFLNDLVIDIEHNYAYISDTGLPAGGFANQGVKGGLIVYDFTTNTARRVLDQHYSVQPDSELWIHINNDPVMTAGPMQAGGDGIAFDPLSGTLYYCPLTSHHFYALPNVLLINGTEEELEGAVASYYKATASDGLSFDNRDTFYITSLEQSGILYTNIPQMGYQEIEVLYADSSESVWPDTIGFDHQGNLLYVSNQLYKYYQNELNFNDTNYRIWSVATGSCSYLDSVDCPF
eukprot:TRINITY_DN9745_c0_g1_i1.p1 TRINITY_DN9745_c0_g1~~TRINITY_DN9745_c0_g1_i1.p1  ORF type:complete len:465 (-),score=78.77 TRINITY_DN9745_c0_g1_i1:52-1323(-)